jgi:hypothetical protein
MNWSYQLDMPYDVRTLGGFSFSFFDVRLAYPPSQGILRQAKGQSWFLVILPVVALLFYSLPFGLSYMIYIALVRSVPLTAAVKYYFLLGYSNCLGILYTVCCTIRPID